MLAGRLDSVDENHLMALVTAWFETPTSLPFSRNACGYDRGVNSDVQGRRKRGRWACVRDREEGRRMTSWSYDALSDDR